MINKKKSDLNKDGKLSGYEKKRGMAIAKSMKGKKYAMGGRVKKAAGGIITADKRGQAVISRSDPFPKAPRAQVKGFGAVRSDVKNFRKG